MGLDGGGRRLHMGGHDLCKIGRANRALGAIDGIGGDEYLGLKPIGQIAAIVLRYHNKDVGPRRLDVLECCLVGGPLAAEDEVVRGLDAM